MADPGHPDVVFPMSLISIKSIVISFFKSLFRGEATEVLMQHSNLNKRRTATCTGPGEGTLGISGWGCAAGTLEPLTYTRPSSAEFCYPIPE